MTFALRPDGPLDVDQTLARFRLWGEDPANLLRPGRFYRAIRSGGRVFGYAVTWRGEPDDVELRVRVGGTRSAAVAGAVRAEVEKIFGIGHDLPGFYRFAKGDPVLAPLTERLYGFRPTVSPVPLEMLVGAVCAQQVNLAFASVLRTRLCARYGTAVAVEGETVYAFPDPETLARVPVAALRALQFSGRKGEYIVGLARAVAGGVLGFEGLEARDNAGVIAELTALRGLGRWSAEWFLARCLGRGDVCPAGDLAVRKAFAHYFHRGRSVGEAAIRRRAHAWGPYQSLGVHYLLAGLRLGRSVGGGE
jgi:DNA-3-methyladenine glycosylase II